MADRISHRRTLANTFFITLNILIITVVGLIYENNLQPTNNGLLFFPLLPILMMCYVWWRLLHSYRQLNTAKYQVIGEYEKRLPSSPYWSAEWKILGEGKDRKLYQPLTNIEKWIPIAFAFLYLIGFMIILLP